MQMSENIRAYYIRNFGADLSYKTNKFSTLHQDENEEKKTYGVNT